MSKQSCLLSKYWNVERLSEAWGSGATGCGSGAENVGFEPIGIPARHLLAFDPQLCCSYLTVRGVSESPSN